jgi:hypothetical protein
MGEPLTFLRYIQAHALAYMMKLNIEMNLADLIGKVVKKSREQRANFSDVEAPPSSPSREAFRRELKDTLRRVCGPSGVHIRGHQASTVNDPGPGGEEEKMISRPAPVKCPFRRDSLVVSRQPVGDHSPFGRAAQINEVK